MFSENPDDIYPYATFILPEADCGAGNGTKVQITAYQQTPDSIRQQIMLTQQDTLMSSQPQISTLVFQEQSTLPLSDACSKSVSCQFDEIFILQLDIESCASLECTKKLNTPFLPHFRVIQPVIPIKWCTKRLSQRKGTEERNHCHNNFPNNPQWGWHP